MTKPIEPSNSRPKASSIGLTVEETVGSVPKPTTEYPKMSNQEPAKAVVKTMKLLEALSDGSSLGVTELARRVSMHKSTVHRFMTTLCELGYARQDQDERYAATLKMLGLGTSVAQSLQFWRPAVEVMQWLSMETRETIHLAALDGLKFVYVHKIESTQLLRVSMLSRIGDTGPFHCTGVGKILLAWQPPSVRKAIIEENPLTRFTENTITTVEQLETELEEVRRTGVSTDDEEHELGVRCLAVPIWREEGQSVIGALSISAPSIRMERKQRRDYEKLLRRASQDVAVGLGLAEEE
jgi:IclR family KDG regulon transcriptional repressor